MLTGLITPTAGDATIDGLSISSAPDMSEIRTSLGVCPQTNVVFEQLTPTQHLVLYGKLKGLEGAELQDEVNDLLEQARAVQRGSARRGAEWG